MSKNPPSPPNRAEYWQRYYAENREKELARKRQWYLDNRDDIIARNQKNQRKKASGGPVYRVGIKRRYVIVAGRAYLNSRLGFTAAELRAIAKEIAESLKG